MVCLKGTEAAGWAMQQDTGPAECLAQRGAACAQHLAGKWPLRPVFRSCSQSGALQVLWALALPHVWSLQWGVGSLGLGASPAARDRTSRHCSRSGGSDGSVAAGAWLCV